MSVYSEVETRKPPAFALVSPSAFQENWEERPTDTVAIGLRLIADADIEDARVEAARRAHQLFPNAATDANVAEVWVSCFTDALVRWIVARGTCDANDVTKPWELWRAAPEDQARETLTDLGARFLFDEWEKMRITVDIGIPEATDADIALLSELAGRLKHLPRDREARARRLLRFVLEELEDAPPDLREPDAAEPTTPAS
jgi:hypothetical protein